MNETQRFLDMARGLAGLSEFVFHDHGGELLLTYRAMSVEEWEEKYAAKTEPSPIIATLPEEKPEVESDWIRSEEPSPEPERSREVRPINSGGGPIVLG